MRNTANETLQREWEGRTCKVKCALVSPFLPVSLGELLRRIYTLRNVSRIKGNGREKTQKSSKNTHFDFILQ